MPEKNKVDLTKLSEKLSESASKVVQFLESKLQADGSYGANAQDISCYFKSPMMFIAAGRFDSAKLILRHIKNKFMSAEGDFNSTSSIKSANAAYIEYWSYTNGWIVRAANQLEISDISIPATTYLSHYNLGKNMGFATNNIKENTGIKDILTLAHHGLIHLEKGNLELAVNTGNLLCSIITKQPNLKKGFYLRLNRSGNLITNFPEEKSPFYFVSTTVPDQLHFMIGYPAAYLAILYQTTKNTDFLNAAKIYLDFSLSCHPSVSTCNYSHKLAWAASIFYKCTGDEKYLSAIEKITDNFISKQKDALWFPEDINSSYDQSAEIAYWFFEIIKNIRHSL